LGAKGELLCTETKPMGEDFSGDERGLQKGKLDNLKREGRGVRRVWKRRRLPQKKSNL